MELTDMVVAYSAAGGKAAQAQILCSVLFPEEFPNRLVPNSKTFTSTVQRLWDTGKFHPRTEDRGRGRSQIFEAVEKKPETSTRRLALQVRVSHHAVWRTLKEQGFHPYHVRKVQVKYQQTANTLRTTHQ
jgi:hypothetical protein